MADVKKMVTDIWAPTESDLQGYCPHCGAEVMDHFNKDFCGKCGKKIKWIKKEN